jgi:hypothetical protein
VVARALVTRVIRLLTGVIVTLVIRVLATLVTRALVVTRLLTGVDRRIHNLRNTLSTV